MRPRTRFVVAAASLTFLTLGILPGGTQEKRSLRPAEIEKLQSLIQPGDQEARWAQVEWMPSSDLWAARAKAAKDGKPIFLWYMAGEPLGTC